MDYLSAIGLKREAVLDRRRGVCVQGELATGGRALPERTEDCRVRTAHHRSVIQFPGRRVGENNFRGFFEPTGEGSGQLVSWRHGGKGDVSRAALSAQSKTVFCAYARASLRLRTAKPASLNSSGKRALASLRWRRARASSVTEIWKRLSEGMIPVRAGEERVKSHRCMVRVYIRPRWVRHRTADSCVW